MIFQRAASKVPSNSFRKFIRVIHGDANSDVKTIIDKIVSVPSTKVGPGASKKSVYKNPEYYCYNNTSYFEAEIELAQYRLKQPSNKTPLEVPRKS